MKPKNLRSVEDLREEMSYPIFVPIPESQFLRKVAKIESRQLDHFVRNKLLSNEKSCRGCSKPGCAHSLSKLPRASRSRSPSPALTYQYSSPNLYHQMQERLHEKKELQRESIAKKERLKSLYIQQLEKTKQEQRAQSKKKRNEKFKQTLKNRESKEREKRKKSQEVVKRLRWKDQKVRGYLESKALQLKQAQKIRRQIQKKKDQLGQKIQALQEQGYDSCSILSILSIESMLGGQKQLPKIASTGRFSNRNISKGIENQNINTQRKPDKAKISQYFNATLKANRKISSAQKNLKCIKK